MRTRLGGNPSALSRHGSLGHPEGEGSGPVPGFPAWEFYFHGRGCCLTHAETGESIDVDFYDGSADYFNPYFYACYLKSLRAPEPAEARLIALHSSFQTVTLAIDELLELGLLQPLGERRGVPRLSDESLVHLSALCAAGERWADPGSRRVMALVLGDWLSADEAARTDSDGAMAAITAPRAGEQRARRRERLVRENERNEYGMPLRALGELDPPDLPDILRAALRAPPCGKVVTAIDVIAARGDPSFAPDIFALLGRVDPAGDIPQPAIWERCSRFLLEHRVYVDRVVGTFPAAGARVLGEAALLAVEYAPLLGPPLLRRAIRSRVPIDRITGAAILVLLGEDWCRRELSAALAESDEHERTAECRAGLRLLGDPENAAAAWEAAHPRAAEAGPFVSMTEVMLRGCDDRIRWEVERLRERVGRMKKRSS
ncbi:MAG: hypothetical protein QM820_54805 [Minicystis sp.]